MIPKRPISPLNLISRHHRQARAPPAAIPGTDFVVRRQYIDDEIGGWGNDGRRCQIGELYTIYLWTTRTRKTNAVFSGVAKMVVSDSIYTLDMEGFRVRLWQAILTPDQVTELRELSDVGIVYQYQPCDMDDGGYPNPY